MNGFRAHILTTTMLAGISLSPAPALAQTAKPAVPDQNQPSNPGAAPPAGPLEANPTPTVSANGAPVQSRQEIVITGSRIPQANLTSAAPVVTLGNQEIKLSGLGRIDDVLNQLPSAAATQGPSLPNPATGTAEIDLRYLGAKRTLSIVNGRRLAPGDPNQATTGAADINLIPASLVKRVEVLTGGASSVYGADAVAGVVNFILDTSYTGLKLDAQYSFFQHNNNCPRIGILLDGPANPTVCDAERMKNFPFPTGSVVDGRAIDATISFGADFDEGRGHVVGYVGYRKQNAILQGNRDYSACALNYSTTSQTTACGGSSFSAEGNFTLANLTSAYHRGPNGDILPGKVRYNYAPLNHWIRPDERYTAGFFANYSISRQINPYAEFMFMDDKTQAQIAPSGNFSNTFTINCDNPFMTAATRAIICAQNNRVSAFTGVFPLTPSSPLPGPATPLTFTDGFGTQYQEAFMLIQRRNVEGGPRQANFSHSDYRAVLGTRGDLSDAFSYDAYYQYGRTKYLQVFKNEESQARLLRSVNAVNDPRPGSPTFGQPICRSVLDGSDPACVPFNYFGTPSAAAIAYINVYGVDPGETSEQIANVNFTGKLGRLGVATPWASEGLGINVGWEYRREQLSLDPDEEFQQGDLTGQGAPTLPNSGNFHVNELFAEAQIPVVSHDFFDDLSFGAGYRKSWYGTSAGRKYSTDTYKLSAEFAPVSDVRFRGSYNRAARAPNIQELFTTPHIALDGSSDPCANKTISATDYGCIAQLKAAGINNPIGLFTPGNPSVQYNGMLGGNPDLVPEKATTKTVGVVLQPRFIPRFAFSVDYWNIDLSGAIAANGADAVIADCVDKSTATFTAPSCSLIHRDPAGSLWLVPPGPGAGYIQDTVSNHSHIRTDGIDINSSYSRRLGGLGNFSLSFLGTYLRHYKVNNAISEPFDCAGLYGTTCSGNLERGSNSPMPRWRHKLRGTLQVPFGLGLSLNWRHVGPVMVETLSKYRALQGVTGSYNDRVKAQEYFDLAATYTLLHSVNLRAGVNNIFDKVPPLIPSDSNNCPTSSCAGNTYPVTWDSEGRYIYFGMTVDFQHHAPPPRPAELPVAPPPPPPPEATITCPDGLIIIAGQNCPAPPTMPPPPPAPAPERG